MNQKFQDKIINLVKKGEINEALSFAIKIANKNSIHDDMAEFLDEIGILLSSELKNHEQALHIFKTSHKLAKSANLKENAAKNCAVANSLLGNLYGKNGKYKEAEKHFKEAIKYNPNFSPAHSGYAYLLFLLEEFNEANIHYQKAIEINPDDPQTHINYTILLDKIQETEKAIFHCEEAINLDQTNPHYLAFHGSLLIKIEKYDESEFQFKKALALNPELIEGNLFYGKLLSKLGRFKEAKIYFKNTMGLDSTFQDVQQNYEYTVMMDMSTDQRMEISKEWLNVRNNYFKRERQNDMKDLVMMKEHQKEWKILYDEFTCERCGICCERTKWITHIDTRLIWEDVERWKKQKKEEILQYVYIYEEFGGDIFNKSTFKRFSKCPFFKKDGKLSSCMIHDTKPFCCVIFPHYFNNQGICPNCGVSISNDELFCNECNLFLKAHPGYLNCPGMEKTLKSLSLYKEIKIQIPDLIDFGFRTRAH